MCDLKELCIAVTDELGKQEEIKVWNCESVVASLRRECKLGTYKTCDVEVTFVDAVAKRNATWKQLGVGDLALVSYIVIKLTPAEVTERMTSSERLIKNAELNDTARNTNDVEKIRALVTEGATLVSINSPGWGHTPMHQAAHHNRPQIIKVLIELCREQNLLGRVLGMESNPGERREPMGRFLGMEKGSGTPVELARGGGHGECAALLERAAETIPGGPTITQWSGHPNIDQRDINSTRLVDRWRQQNQQQPCVLVGTS